MATAVKKASCFTCGKEKGGTICAGCSKMFCLSHFNDHRQELNNQLDEVYVTRDLFRQSLTESTSEPQEHPLIEEINQWETESINKIQQAAEEARQLLIQHTTGLNTQLEERLKQLTDQLRQSREENEFFETDLNQWKEELIRMENELIKPLNVTIREDPTPLVTRITVDISSHQHQNTDSRNDSHIPCEWCNKGISWFVYEDHAKICREEYQRQQQHSQLSSQETTANTTAIPLTTTVPFTGKCLFCGTEKRLEGLAYHHLCCTKNPHRIGRH